MEYRDFFRHIEKRVEKRKRKESRLRAVSQRLAEKLDVSQLEALSKLQNRPMLREWMEAEKQKDEQFGDNLIRRLKDKSDAPSVGDTVKVQFNEKARGYLTPQQENINGRKGTVTIRDGFSKGSQRARYTVEVTGEDGQPHTIHNLTPGEVNPT